MTDPLVASGVIAVVRLREAGRVHAVARALAAGGVGAVEITLTTPGAVAAIGELVADEGLRGCVVGAGTVLDALAARGVIAAGARFVVSPTLEPDVIRVCRDHAVPCMPGAFSPTEILTAWRAGASLVKVFPAAAVGPRYFREVLAPLPFLRLVPSGGVSLESAGDWILAGAAAVSVGGALVNAALSGNESGAGGTEGTEGAGAEAVLAARARALVECVAVARRRRAGDAP